MTDDACRVTWSTLDRQDSSSDIDIFFTVPARLCGVHCPISRLGLVKNYRNRLGFVDEDSRDSKFFKILKRFQKIVNTGALVISFNITIYQA